jgi:hypothetical protein
LIAQLRHTNPALAIERKSEPIRVAGERALSTFLFNDSPLSGREMIWLVTVLRADGLSFILSVAPQNDYDRYGRSFENVVRTVHFH